MESSGTRNVNKNRYQLRLASFAKKIVFPSGIPVILGEGHAADALKSIVDEIIAAVPKINPLDCTAHTSMETSVTIANS